MPLEELLALYGYDTNDKETSSESEEEEHDQHSAELEQTCETIVEKERSPTPSKQSKLSLLYEPIVEDLDESRNDECKWYRLISDDRFLVLLYYFTVYILRLFILWCLFFNIFLAVSKISEDEEEGGESNPEDEELKFAVGMHVSLLLFCTCFIYI